MLAVQRLEFEAGSEAAIALPSHPSLNQVIRG
jgi:hypothetical protein